jgi:hypothetical protein
MNNAATATLVNEPSRAVKPRREEGDEHQGDQREHAHGRRGPTEAA